MINTQFKFEGVIKNSYFLQFLQFGGRFDIDGQGQGHQFLNSSETCRSKHSLILIFQNGSKVITFTNI